MGVRRIYGFRRIYIYADIRTAGFPGDLRNFFNFFQLMIWVEVNATLQKHYSHNVTILQDVCNWSVCVTCQILLHLLGAEIPLTSSHVLDVKSYFTYLEPKFRLLHHLTEFGLLLTWLT
jgi:hypothetical protein